MSFLRLLLLLGSIAEPITCDAQDDRETSPIYRTINILS
jgi:hypothetical protein